jgi:hypothetical protein
MGKWVGGEAAASSSFELVLAMKPLFHLYLRPVKRDLVDEVIASSSNFVRPGRTRL